MENKREEASKRTLALHSQISLIARDTARWTPSQALDGGEDTFKSRHVRMDTPVQMERHGTVSRALAEGLLPLNTTTWKLSQARTLSFIVPKGKSALQFGCLLFLPATAQSASYWTPLDATGGERFVPSKGS